jgi:predicted dehydrogenase
MTPSFHAAVVGVGRMGARHLAAIERAGGTVTAIADLDAARLEEATSVARHAKTYRDWRALVDHERVDLLSVATTSAAHAAIVVAAAEAGVRRILCEKPIATTVVDARRVVDVCRDRHVRLVVNHSRRASQGYQELRAAIDAGRFGELRLARVTCGAAGLANVGTHAFDLMRWFCGDALTVTGYVTIGAAPNPRGAHFSDPGGHGVVMFGDGRRATFDFSDDFSASFVVELGCAFGWVAVDERSGRIDARARTPAGRQRPMHEYMTPTEIVPLPFDGPLDIVGLTAAMAADAMADGEDPLCSGADGLAALEIAAAVHLSHAQGHAPIRLPLADDGNVLARIA